MPPLFPELPEIAELVANPTAADYAAAAKYALKRKKRPLAVQQVTAAIALEPQNPRYLQLLSDIVGTTPDPFGLLRLTPQGVFYGVAAARAWTLAKHLRSTEATQLLAEVVQFRPNVPFIPWLQQWQERFEWGQRVTPDAMAELLRSLVGELAAQGMEAGGEENLDSALRAAEELQRIHPDNDRLRTTRMWCHRLLDEPDVALALATERPVTWEVALERALAHRALSQIEDELKALGDAAEMAPGEPAVYQELATTLVMQGRRRAAEEVLLRANSQAPTAWSLAAHAYLRWLDREQAPLDFTNDAVAQPFLRDTRCYRDVLPDPCDVAVAVVRSALSRASEPGAPQRVDVRAQVIHRPAPSARLAFDLGLAALSKNGELSLVGATQATVLGELWRMDRDRATPLLPAPTPRLVAAIEGMATTRFEWSRWLEAAEHIAHEEASTVSPRDVLSVALYPPPAPASADAVQWLTHVHAAVAVILGVMDSRLSGNEIEQCLSATDDWICIVGIVALYAAVTSGNKSRDEACGMLESLLAGSEQRPSYARALAVTGTLLAAGHRAEAFKDLRAKLVFDSSERRQGERRAGDRT